MEEEFKTIFGFDISLYLSNKSMGVYYFKHENTIAKVYVDGFKTVCFDEDIDIYPQIRIYLFYLKK